MRRKPQYISPGLIGGSISIFIYQGANLALTQGPFTAGTTYGAYDFYCAYSQTAQEIVCTNYSNVFAPLGSDTFYASMYDSANHLLSVTPGMPGTNFVTATQPAYTITSVGISESDRDSNLRGRSVPRDRCADVVRRSKRLATCG